ncbi:myosin-like protein [Achlya hypogyna]|uniref:Myosin-like protein n=1 Tax=Achlya hypogyna TaxID=1202772 RepID=A0A1V9ZE31_ACHHY|nr:myosin-like protein [Achlya hypogyna]
MMSSSPRLAAALKENDRIRAQLQSAQASLEAARSAHADEMRRAEETIAALAAQVAELRGQGAPPQEATLVSAKVIDSRVASKDGRKIVEFRLALETTTLGTLFVWHRYSTFRNLAKSLRRNHPNRVDAIPELPDTPLFGLVTNGRMHDRLKALNAFLQAVTDAEDLQWGIRVDPTMCVFKRRQRPRPSAASTLAWSDDDESSHSNFVEPDEP